MTKRPRVRKDKNSDGFYVDWYGIRVWFGPPDNEPVTNEYSNPLVGVSETDESKPPKFSFYVEGEE